MNNGHAIDRLKQALRRLPGVGPKTAQRMAFYLLERDRDGARALADALREATASVEHCQRCNNFSETELCQICASGKRDDSLLCVVETPADLDTIEQAGAYSGYYLVLMGHLSPLDGVGPEDLAIDHLMKVVSQNAVQEVILATNLTMEGEATADHLSDLLDQSSVRVSRLARGVPVGGELEYMDANTLNQAFNDRRTLQASSSGDSV
ncbi:MAG: recombination protein RecR [Proteobacteria bacterium]|jgi:recombination protein RecR|nr:recombination protein RecR [Pseudomonadota bacterium]MBP10089.1 recombination protein RecR [Acidiferrobacteraceae bacterium]MDP6137729.1 recombination mediator RecR [Arenicellales bacterium]HCF74951.1 recombination protein RecR [Gammaproteobacteria bacterium]MBI18886.1 recombination protein RecR [Pseudomonadota bacterium]|tara:strand:- start:23 stop:646 length:624 start_codon:yes stop_codon:yes gene_type:complete